MTTPMVNVAERLAGIEALDRPVTWLADGAESWDGPVADLARGAPLGHKVHPALTDLPIGFWTSAFTLDLIGGRRHAGASRALVGLGVITAAPTAVAGFADLPTLDRRKRRAGLIHASANTLATLLYAKSWWARRGGRRMRGIALGMFAAALATFGGYLGGWMAFGKDTSAKTETGAEPDRIVRAV